MKNLLFITLLSILTWQTAYSSHISGGDVTYTCVGPNQYEITVKLFRDCDGINAPNSVSIRFDNTCGLANPPSLLANVTPNATTGNNFTDISQLCPTQINNSTCNNGNLPGMQMYEYTATVTLPAACDSWTFYYTTCCRNNAVTNVSANGTYIGATLNSVTSPCNNSADFTSQPVPYVCANQLVNYNFGVVEQDGDSLAYQFVSASQNYPSTPLNYNAPFTANAPIQGITLDQTTGQLTFTPTATGNYVVVVEVTEYDANGNIKGTTFRDIQFVVIACSNQVLDANPVNITNQTGDGTITGPKEFEACEGDSFCFDFTLQDPDAGDVLSLTSNVATSFPGATITTAGTNPMVVTVCATVPAGTNPFNVININVRDDACPIAGQTNFSVVVKVITSTTAGPDKTICLGDDHQLLATGGSVFNWRAITGPAIAVGTNFSCNPCANPLASPTATTTYEVTSDLSGGCYNIDTVTITVAPNFTYTITQSSLTSCRFEAIDFEIIPTPAGAYTYSWTPGTMLNSTTIANPTLTPTQAGSFGYVATVTSAQGCVKIDSLRVNVSAGVKPDVTAMTDVDTIRCNGIANLEARVDSSIAIIDLVDAFDVTTPSALWSNFTGATLNAACETRNLSTGSLVFDGGSGDRTATTVPLQANVCSTIDFWMKPANGRNGCNSPESVDNIMLQYSTNGGASWVTLRTYTTTMWGSTFSSVWQNYVVPIPATAAPIMLRFNQPASNYLGAGFDYWLLEDVSISCSSLSSYTYAWSPTPTLTGWTSNMSVAAPQNTTLYSVVVTDTTSGCADTSDVEVAVASDYPTIQFEIDTNEGCYPVTVNFKNTTDQKNVGTVEWDFGNGTSTDATDNVLPVVYNTPGVYNFKLKVTSPFGCVSDTTVDSLIMIYDYPIADFQAGPQPTNVTNSTINFTDLSTNDVTNWEWTFGINDPSFQDTSSLQNPIISYPDLTGGTYEAKLIVNNVHQCYDSITRTVIIDDLYTLHVPNSFTPDNDGVNDFFSPVGEKISENGYEFRVFDRWGNLLFITANTADTWDGTSSGVDMPAGIYMWTVTSIDGNNGERHRNRGHVQIVR